MLPSDPKPANGRPELSPSKRAGQPQISIRPADLTMKLLELELSLDGYSAGRDGFSAHVATAVSAIGGELLFELPASGLIADCERIAVLRMPQEGAAGTVFACLETGGTTIRIERPTEETACLQSFAGAFVEVLRRI